MAVVIAPRPRGLQPIHSPVSSLIEPAEIGDKPTVTEPPPTHHTVKGTVDHKDGTRVKSEFRHCVAYSVQALL